MSAIRVLYAEDNVQDAELTRTHLSEHAPEIALEVVETGRECLDRLRAGEHDVLLLDHYLPDMEGLDVLRTLARSGPSVPVVLVSGAGDEELVVKALRLGASNYLPKAGRYLETLPALLHVVVEEHRSRESRGLVPTAPRRVLYVEHNEMDIELTLRHFADAVPQVEVDVVRSFPEALSRLGRPPPLDAVLIDLRMPGQSGLDFVRDARRRGVPMPPFIVITGKGDEETAIASLKLGAADYVAKREGYLDQLASAIDRAVAHERLERLSTRLQEELAEREGLQAQLLQSQRMEGIGRLAGGVAHDFNNLLSVILTYTDCAMEATREGDQLREDLQEVRRAAERAVTMTRQLLAFSRRQLLQPVALSLNDVAAGMQQMLRRTLGEDVEIVQVLAPDLGLVRADAGQMEQVLLNLAINAREAMPGGGKLTIETSNVDLDEDYASRHVGVKPGPHVQLAVTDTGCGMDEQTKSKLFEPFFTTKEMGTGLGLSSVYGIVKQSGGQIWTYSEVGRGTTFKIQLPRETSAAASAVQAAPSPSRVTGTETILVVEDEAQLRRVSRRCLEAAGYTVLTAANGEEALQVSARHDGEIHLLFTDVVMPRMTGRALAEQIARKRPSIKVLYTSGYADSSIVKHGVLDPGTNFLGKPATAADLTRKVREVLDRP